MQLEGQAIDIIYKNDINSYTVATFETSEQEETTIVGYLPFVNEGDNLKINLRQLPECTDKDYADNFLELFSVLLCGLYKGWFEQTGAPNALKCVVVSLKPQELVLALKA